jgi:plasmid maintenance system antidote protein VapI
VISIFLEDLLSKQGISVSALSRRSGVPYSTTHELVHGKKALEKAAAETVYRISRVLDVSMEELVIGALRDKAWNAKTKPTDK